MQPDLCTARYPELPDSHLTLRLTLNAVQLVQNHDRIHMRAVESQRLIQQVNCLPKVVPLLVLLSNRRSDCRILAFMSRIQPNSCSDFLLLPGYLAFALAFSATASAVLSSVNMTCKRHKYLLVAHHDSSFLFSSLLQGQR